MTRRSAGIACLLLLPWNNPPAVRAFQPLFIRAGASPRSFPKSLAQRLSEPTTSSRTQFKAWPLDKDPKGMPTEFPNQVARIGITTASTLSTWYTHAQNHRYSNVLGSSAVTLVSSLVAPGLGQAAMCGTFAGMSSSVLVPNWKYALVLGALTATLFEVLIHSRNLYLGLGGRLGATAFIGSNVIAALQGISTGVTAESFSKNLERAPIGAMAVFSALGSVATIALREASDDTDAADPVRAAAVIGLFGSLLVGFGGFTEVGALAVYGGAFVGMSLPSRLMHGIVPGGRRKDAEKTPKPPTALALMTSFAIAGALGGLVHALSIGWGWWSGGWGGKAGACSFFGVLLYRGLSKTLHVATSKSSGA